ncbi:MAPEG family protein [Bradyrhizobium amphicarpaeae]|uniref:MAPEG family protein n=1 Tax=Bradyrhizobium amphicarpaeae TaxID=1404768 RepID=A0A2U8Q1J6_9BRAD|nr:MAPEG family protein [Bradyrhizobium amphicarpaeae]AWM03328.1 hypothetical protein CIT40_26990 [Bradyrhizobium amphicarpaeae]
MLAVPVTLSTISVLAIAYAFLSVAVGRQRGVANVSLGLGSESVAIGRESTASPLLVAVRRHAQFAEYVPISILLLLLLEISHAHRIALMVLAAMLMASRLAMAAGLGRDTPNPLRTAGNLLQWGMILASSVYGMVLAVLAG